MKAIILAAGKATRLLPLTKDTPQCLLKVNNKKILERQIDALNQAGIKGIIVVTGHLFGEVEKFCQGKNIKCPFNPFYEVSNMALTLWTVKDELKEEFIVLYSDVLFDSKIVKGLIKSKEDICLAIKKGELREEAEKVIESGGIIEGINKINEDKKNAEYIGISKFSGKGNIKLVEELDLVAKKDLNTSFIKVVDNLIKKGEKTGVYDIKDSRFIDIDFPEDLKKAEELFI